METSDILQFLGDRMDELGDGFHPGTDFHDYINSKTGKAFYSSDDAEGYNQIMSGAFEAVGDEVYEMAYAIWEKRQNY